MNDPNYYLKFRPKSRTGNECKKISCKRHKSYTAWKLGNSDLAWCMECRNAHISQYEAIPTKELKG